jgi:hypothetical protein
VTSIAAPPSGTFASKVVIKDMVKIQACYRGARCTGMAFSFANNRVEILGQWFEYAGRHELLFDVISNRRFTGLRFELHGSDYNTVVRKVTSLTTETGNTHVPDMAQDAKYYVSTPILIVYFQLTMSRILLFGYTPHCLMK